MTSYEIRKLKPEEYNRCNNIWNMEEKPNMAKLFYDELVSGSRIPFIYIVNNEFLGEGSLVYSNNDPDYTIPNKRIYLSRMVVKEEFRNLGIGSIIVDYLIDYPKNLDMRK
ncbi:GNAT family N-acetyltransferase [Gracilibacillus saliphilus]|uniref:GNAT family N-acetyltransferase n=1 Tax=Gracilibacillus saliphilus TaxID=543890 RepID=UPI001EE1C720|nr:GNAT family N-acetyltransferase [Gracilibacillus saliphilus]